METREVYVVFNYEIVWVHDGDELVEDGRNRVGIYATFPLKSQAEEFCRRHNISFDDIEKCTIEGLEEMEELGVKQIEILEH